jgi:hypothetical protein
VQATRDELVGQSFGFYRSVLGEPKASISDKLKAQQCIDDLLALRVARTQHHELTGPNGTPLAPPVTNVQVLVTLPDNGRGDRSPLDSACAQASPKAIADTAAPSPAADGNGNGSDDLAEDVPFDGTVTGADFLKEN